MGLTFVAQAETYRIATYNTGLSRNGPGIFLRDLLRGDDAQINAVLAVIAYGNADVLALQNIDYDLTGEALGHLAEAASYPYWFALRPNTGLATGDDMDGDGRCCGPRDAQGYGRFTGQGGMAILSRYPILEGQVQDLSALLWEEVPDALLPEWNDQPFPDAEARARQRLSTTGHWIVPLQLPGGTVHLMTFHASPPVFDGPEDRNGRRNHDEITLWQHILYDNIATAPPGPFVIAGQANLDPDKGEGRHKAITRLLSDPQLHDAAPVGHRGGATVNWSVGEMRVSYVLPSTHWQIIDSAVFWPAPEDPMAQTVARASRHHLVWVDLALSSLAE